jgi:hypothetical protein
MLPPNLPATVGNTEPQPPKPQLRPIHLVLWIVATAALVTLKIAGKSYCGPTVVGVGPWTSIALEALTAALYGAAVVAAGVLIRNAQSPSACPLQPGHWLLINSAAVHLLGILISQFWRYADLVGYRENGAIINGAACCLFSAWLFWFAKTRLPETDRWRTSFRLFALAYVLGAASSLSFLLRGQDLLSGLFVALLLFVMGAVGLVACGSFTLSAMTDINSGCRRDSLHWFGVAASVAAILISIAWDIARRLALP